MIKSKFVWSVVMAFGALIMTACGGVNYSDPKSVADAALECYDKGNYEGMLELVAPDNTFTRKQLTGLAETVKNLRETRGDEAVDATLTPKQRTFEEVVDGHSGHGREVTAESTKARVRYEGDYPNTVFLKKVDGKWYYERFQ